MKWLKDYDAEINALNGKWNIDIKRNGYYVEK